MNGYVHISTAADILNVSVETLRLWDKNGTLKARRNPENKYRLYKISDLETFSDLHNLRHPKQRHILGD